MKPVIFFDPDGYLLTGPKLMGRHSAGNGFLRAAVADAARTGEPLTVSVLSNEAAAAFRDYMAEAAPGVRYELASARRIDVLAAAGLSFRPDVMLVAGARLRLRAGPAAYSLCGVTHTMATDKVQGLLAAMPLEPLMPWDAVICTSRAAQGVARRVMDAAEAQLHWMTRGGGDRPGPLPNRPMLPVIPLGVHCDDYGFSAADRAAARAELGLAPETVAFLSPGRISLNAKAHPYALLAGLQAAARRTGRPLALVFAGQAEQPQTLRIFERGAASLCPDVRVIFVDGADPGRFRRTWAAADVFISLSDNIQETFGLTPIEAMAAGLPALVSDWDGYKDTVRDGVDGFRVATWAPPPGAGQRIAADYQTGEIDYGTYLARTSLAVAVDLRQLAERLDALIGDADRRRRMGAAGRARAREIFDWAVVYRQYQALWAEQDAVRLQALSDPAMADWLAQAPRFGAGHLGPFDAFEGFATGEVTADTQVALDEAMSGEAYRALVAHETLAYWRVAPEVFDNFAACLSGGPLSVGDLAARSGIDLLMTCEAVARLAKLGALALSA